MSEITASMVKELRDKTGAGMMDAKKALTENNGDMEAAIDYLRTKGLATAEKKAGRAAADGLVAVITEGNVGAIVEVNAETDFVARNEQFQEFVQAVARLALETEGDLEKLLASTFPAKCHSVQEELTNLITTIGENITIRRVDFASVEQGVVASYMHGALVPNMGKIGVLIALSSEGDISKLDQLGKHIAMHVAATNPLAITKDGLDGSLIERERAVFTEQALESGKPPEIVEKMVEGRLRKFYEEVVLMEQVFVIDGESKVGQMIEKEVKAIGADINPSAFTRFALGEGVEKGEDNFADEVKQMVS